MMTQIKRCHGAGIGREKPETYNKRSMKAMENLSFNFKDLIIVGRGRAHDEVSFVQIESGKFKGFGFMDKNESMSDPSALETFITLYDDNPDARRIIRTYMARNQSDQVVTY
jgi:DNA polymerase-3 subunit epsilon